MRPGIGAEPVRKLSPTPFQGTEGYTSKGGSPSDLRRLLIVCLFPDWGHSQPLLRAALAAREKGISSTFILPSQMAPFASAAGFPVHPIEIRKPARAAAAISRLARMTRFRSGYISTNVINNYLLPEVISDVCASLDKIHEVTCSENFDMMIADSHHFAVVYQHLAGIANVPLVLLNASGTQAKSNYQYDFIFGRSRKPEFFKDIVERVGMLYAKADKALRNFLLDVHWRKERKAAWMKIGSYLSNHMSPCPDEAVITVQSGFGWVERLFSDAKDTDTAQVAAPPCPPAYHPLAAPLEEWLDKGQSDVVYVSLGSMVALSNAEFEAFAYNLDKLPYRVIISLPTCDEAFIQSLRICYPDMYIVNYVDQPSLLAHSKVRCFVTHGGASSVLESLYVRTPMVVVPFLFDQFYIASVVRHIGLGVQVNRNEILGDSLSIAINTVISHTEIQEKLKEVADVLGSEESRFGIVEVFRLWFQRCRAEQVLGLPNEVHNDRH